jgi:hypothetical protein
VLLVLLVLLLLKGVAARLVAAHGAGVQEGRQGRVQLPTAPPGERGVGWRGVSTSTSVSALPG